MAIAMNALQSVLSIIVMILLGYYLARKGWFNDSVPTLFSRLLIGIAIPALLISSLTSNFSKDDLMNSGVGILAVYGAIGVSYGTSMIVAKLLNVKRGRRGIFYGLSAFANTVFVGLPVTLALFGDKSIPFALLYYFANTSLFWTIGAYGIQQDGTSEETSIFTWTTLKKIVSPPLIAFAIAVVLILSDIKLPSFIANASKYMGNLSTPLSMIYLGIIISSTGLRGVKFDKDMLAVMLGRFLVTPLLVFSFLKFVPVTDLMRNVFIIQSAMPVLTQSAILAHSYNSDHEFA
ncbi:MAG: AEC family transporter, partial [Clostridia bacterium]